MSIVSWVLLAIIGVFATIVGTIRLVSKRFHERGARVERQRLRRELKLRRWAIQSDPPVQSENSHWQLVKREDPPYTPTLKQKHMIIQTPMGRVRVILDKEDTSDALLVVTTALRDICLHERKKIIPPSFTQCADCHKVLESRTT